MQGIAIVLQAGGFRTHVQDSQLGIYQIGRVPNMKGSQTRFSRPRNTRTSIRLNAVRFCLNGDIGGATWRKQAALRRGLSTEQLPVTRTAL